MAGAHRSSAARRLATYARHACAASPAPMACAAIGSSAVVTPMPTIMAAKPIDAPHAGAREVVHRHAADDGRVDEGHRDEPQLGQGDGDREADEAPELGDGGGSLGQRAASKRPAAPMPPPMHIVTMA